MSVSEAPALDDATAASPHEERAGLEIEGVAASYNGHEVVHDFSLNVAEGEFITLLGPSGCGKTTMLRCVAGLHRIDRGTIRIGGRVVATGRAHVPPERRGVNMVFQSYALWPHMTAFQNVAYGLQAQKRPKAEIRERVTEVLRLVGMSDYAERGATELSGGQQQRIALARGIATRPQLLLLDEPLSNLDSELRARMRREIASVQRQLGLTTLYVTHDRVEALSLSDRVVVLREGVVQQIGSPDELYYRPVNRFVAEALGDVNVLQAIAVDGRLRVERDDVLLPLAAGGGVRDGDPVEVFVRPEWLTPATSGPAVSATVVSSEFLGNRTVVTCRRGDEQLRVELGAESPSAPAPGDVVRLAIRVRDSALPTAAGIASWPSE